ncbi:non-canonical purine NTP pyrophosphatase [Bradyrhizobium sp. WYCCWR 13022]|uniref:non-canonical purine NTP pyrophosphatase n=1 Tax=unclassified Bradyrhizobium TaxID=2631580 RepID=UPI00263B78F5|nr:non-canonical purine NTP pyrophosphatase [Bradyrhizobium sp. WYCCWR 13022]MDN4984658.1 non-canonical purine NTP pyrophosphatase [Bradyrhizobium sp. WYCCWR 13022]
MRPEYGNALRFDRVLNVYFYTSNADKLFQARLMFVRHGYNLRHFRGRREPYDEDYSLGSEQLLNRAIKQVNAEFGVRSLFFVEDTSLRLEGLSRDGDFPGLAVKEWFSSTSFEELDRALSQVGDRRAIVKSDIALYVPTLSHNILFHAETVGQVARSKPDFEPSHQYPWLTPSTFNGWFVPEGSTKRLGEMEFEESLRFDFRAKSLSALITRLEELNSALNLSPAFYTARKPPPPSATDQLLFKEILTSDNSANVLLVIGFKCAGKTTLSDHLAARDDVMVVEASSVLRSLAQDAEESVETADDAFKFLSQHGLDCVAQTIGTFIERGTAGLYVVTGLRTVEEVLLLVERFPQARIVFVDSDLPSRFERHVRRGRDQDVRTLTEFRRQDEQQAHFGVLRVANEVATDAIRNDTTLEEFKQRIDAFVGRLDGKQPERVKSAKVKTELHRTLAALEALGGAGSCDAIALKTLELNVPVRKYNTNRALKSIPEFAERVKRSGHLLSYRITARGQHLLELLNRISGR